MVDPAPDPARPAPADTPGWVLPVAVLLHATLSSIINLWVFPGGYLNGIASATGGLVLPTLVANAGMLLLVVGVVVLRCGRLRLRDLDLTHGFLHALAIAICIWALAQVVGWASGDGSLDPRWSDQPRWQVGRLLDQVLGNALYEEIVFRAFLIGQIAWWLARRRGRTGLDRRCLGGAIVLSQLIFALQHIPNRIFKDSYDSLAAMVQDQGVLLLAGLVFAALYMSTGNLWLCVLLHALVNRPTSLFVDGGAGQVVTGAAPLVLACAFGFLRFWRARSKAGPLPEDGSR